MALNPNWRSLEARHEESNSEAEDKNIAPGSPLASPTMRGFSHGGLNLSDSRYYVDRDKEYHPQSSKAYGTMGEWLEGSNHEDRVMCHKPVRTRKAKQDLTSNSRQRISDSISLTSSLSYRHGGKDSRATSRRRGGDIDILTLEQKIDARAKVPRQPEIRTKSRDEKASESAANSEYPERSFASHMHEQLITALDSRERLPASQDSEGPKHCSSDSDHGSIISGSIVSGLRGQSDRVEVQQARCSSDPSADAGESECLIPYSVFTKTEREDYAEDCLQGIRSRLLRAWETRRPTRWSLILSIPCNVPEFMRKQFAGSNKNLGRVITLSGTATCGQATTCSDYIHSTWPLRGLWLLDILQDALDGTKSNAAGKSIVALYMFRR